MLCGQIAAKKAIGHDNRRTVPSSAILQKTMGRLASIITEYGCLVSWLCSRSTGTMMIPSTPVRSSRRIYWVCFSSEWSKLHKIRFALTVWGHILHAANKAGINILYNIRDDDTPVVWFLCVIALGRSHIGSASSPAKYNSLRLQFLNLSRVVRVVSNFLHKNNLEGSLSIGSIFEISLVSMRLISL